MITEIRFKTPVVADDRRPATGVTSHDGYTITLDRQTRTVALTSRKVGYRRLVPLENVADWAEEAAEATKTKGRAEAVP